MPRAAVDPDTQLTERQLRFVERYLAHIPPNGTQAAIEAGFSPKRAARTATDLLNNPAVKNQIEQRQAVARQAFREQAEFDRDALLQELWHTALADDTEISQVHRICCRFCHGTGHTRQYTPAEWRNAQANHAQACREAEAEKLPAPPPLDEPDGWYNGKLSPHPDCPECFGRGQEVVYLADTRTLSPFARRLYAGVKITKDGIEVKTRSKEGAQDKLMRHLGMYEADNKQGVGALAQSIRDVMSGAATLRPAASGATHDDPGDDDD